MSQYSVRWGVAPRDRAVLTDEARVAQELANSLLVAGWPGIRVTDTDDGRTIPWRTVNWRQW